MRPVLTHRTVSTVSDRRPSHRVVGRAPPRMTLDLFAIRRVDSERTSGSGCTGGRSAAFAGSPRGYSHGA